MGFPDLSRLRFPVPESRGRRYPELPHPWRNEFQRDRDRIVHARAFRRLEDKTQVFTAGLSDHFRNRLTHTFEVAQIARTVARVLGLDEDLTEALALAHDIGHPPFAHAGEHELDRQMARFGCRFDHNLHALRIVESFEQRYARFPGLNLTFEVREGMVKHSRDLGMDCPAGLAEYLPGLRPPLEAQLIDLCDEIAYNTADLDDASSAGICDARELAARLPVYAAIWEDVEMQFPGAGERIQFQESLRRLIDYLVTSLVEETYARSESADLRTHDGVRRLPGRLAALTPEAAAANAEVKRFLHERVYNSAPLVEERKHAAAMIAGLFEFYLGNPDRMPAGYAELAREEPVHRVVCDYIAGMTDGFFRRTYHQMLGGEPCDEPSGRPC